MSGSPQLVRLCGAGFLYSLKIHAIMKKLIALALATACAASAFSQAKQVPYSSTFCQDADWTVINTAEGTSTWEDNDYSRDFKGTGFSVGKEYGYDRKNPADDWLISPAVHLLAGVEYKV